MSWRSLCFQYTHRRNTETNTEWNRTFGKPSCQETELYGMCYIWQNRLEKNYLNYFFIREKFKLWNVRNFSFWHCVFKSHLLQRHKKVSIWERVKVPVGRKPVAWEECCVNHSPHMTILLPTTLNIFCPIIENLYNWMDNLWLKVINIVAKGEIDRFEQFLLLSQCFQKAVGERLYEGKS